MLRPSRLVALSFAIAFCSGCRDTGPTLYDVEGTVLLKGKPLEKVRVEFWPTVEGPQSEALTDDQGRFSLKLSDGVTKGAVAGKHKVVLKDVSIYTGQFMGRSGADVDMAKGQKPRIASTYTNVTMTPLEADITAEQKDLKFEVQPFKR